MQGFGVEGSTEGKDLEAFLDRGVFASDELDVFDWNLAYLVYASNAHMCLSVSCKPTCGGFVFT